MKKETLLAIAAAITAIANDLDGDVSTLLPAPGTGGNTGDTAAPKRGRPPGKATPPPAEEEPEGPTVEELKALFQPLIKGGKMAEVKAAISKYGASVSDIPANKRKEFAADIEALLL